MIPDEYDSPEELEGKSVFWDSDHEHYEGTRLQWMEGPNGDSYYLEIIDVVEGREIPLYDL